MRDRWDGDRDPMAALRRGEPILFEAFVRREAATLLGFFQRLGAPRHEAEDLVQEVFLKLFRSVANYAPCSAFSAFTLRVARNAWIDHRRRGAMHQGGVTQAGEIPDPCQPAVVREESERLQGCLVRLSDAQRIVFELAVVQELPYAQIAEVLGIPVGTVKSRVFHAVRRLRAVLAGEHDVREVGA